VNTPVEGGRGVGLRVFGIPVHIDLSFVLVMGFIGWLGPVRTLRDIVIWLVVAALAVLVHELGHAVVARSTGARPVIALTGFGGVTFYSSPHELSRGRSLAISVAGPFTGLAVGALLWGAERTVGADLDRSSVAALALGYGLFTTIAWSVLNLLPVLPLDGGQAMRELLPGSPEVRARRAAVVSLTLLVPLFGLALWTSNVFVAVFLLLFGFTNLQTVLAGSGRAESGPGGARHPGAPAPATLSPEQAVVGLLWQGATVQARQMLESLPQGTTVDLAVHGVVLATTGQPQQGEALLRQEMARRPADRNVAALLVLAHTLRHDWDAVVADLQSGYAAIVSLSVVERAVQEAVGAGRPDVAARLNAMPRPETR
jgi:Zn-dependent protease